MFVFVNLDSVPVFQFVSRACDRVPYFMDWVSFVHSIKPCDNHRLAAPINIAHPSVHNKVIFLVAFSCSHQIA